MSPQIIIPGQIPETSSGFIELRGDMLPATLQADSLGPSETVVVNSVAGFAIGLLAITGTPSPGDSVTIASRTYTFVGTIIGGDVDPDGDVLVGANDESAIDNLIAAINLGPGAGTLYAENTAKNTDVSAVDASLASQLYVLAKIFGAAGDSIATTATGAAAWSTPTLVAGTTQARESGVLIELTQTNNRLAINSPIRIEVVKSETVSPVTVSLAYRNQV